MHPLIGPFDPPKLELTDSLTIYSFGVLVARAQPEAPRSHRSHHLDTLMPQNGLFPAFDRK